MYKNTILPLQDEIRQHKYDEFLLKKKKIIKVIKEV